MRRAFSGKPLGRSLATSLGGARFSWALAGLLVAVWLWMSVRGGPLACLEVYERFGLTWGGLRKGWVWQVWTHAFLHGSSFHLLMNVVWLVLVGGKLEHILGSRTVAWIFLAGVTGGAIGHLALSSGGSGAPILVGASGGAMALLLALTTLSPESRMWPLPVSGKNLGLGLLAGSLLLALFHPQSPLSGLRQVGEWLARHAGAAWFAFGHACHFGGGMAGWLAGRWILRPRTITREALLRQRALKEAKSRRGD